MDIKVFHKFTVLSLIFVMMLLPFRSLFIAKGGMSALVNHAQIHNHLMSMQSSTNDVAQQSCDDCRSTDQSDNCLQLDCDKCIACATCGCVVLFPYVSFRQSFLKPNWHIASSSNLFANPSYTFFRPPII